MAFNGLSSDELPDYDIVEFSCGSFDGTAELTIRCYGKQFHIQVLERNLDDDSDIKREYQRLLQRLDDPVCPEVDGDADADPMEDLCFWIAHKCNSQMRDLASTSPPRFHTLKDWLCLETIVLNMTMMDGQVVTKACPPDPSLVANLTHQMALPVPFQTLGIPVIHPSSILLPSAVESEQVRPTKVFFESGTFFFKPANSYSQAVREIRTLLRLKTLGLIPVVHVPVLHGLVRSPEDDTMICGYLLEYIEHRDTLGRIEVKDEPLTVRAEWVRQLERMMSTLHDAEIIWGDAKPDNILIDTDNKLRLIDFGGGHTYGWVDADKAESIEGDKQALSRMIKFVLAGEQPI